MRASTVCLSVRRTEHVCRTGELLSPVCLCVERNVFVGQVNSYRLSISWPRIIPDPLSGDVNPQGVAYYNRVIDSLLANGIAPCVTLYHWDLPLALEEEVGGWPKEGIIPYFRHYAHACFQAFGDRVGRHRPLSWCFTSTETARLIRDGDRVGSHRPLSWCFTSTETARLIKDGERVGRHLPLFWCFTSTETTRLIRGGDRVGRHRPLSWRFTSTETTRLIGDGDRVGRPQPPLWCFTYT